MFHPTAASGTLVTQGPFRLIVISHGFGGSPCLHADLARAFTEQEFTVAPPQHRGDNYCDVGEPGPVSWSIRPCKMSTASDVVD